MAGPADSGNHDRNENNDDRASEPSRSPARFHPTLTPARQPIRRTAEEEALHWPRAQALTSIIPPERVFLGVPTLPSLAVFQVFDNVPRATQFFFNGDAVTPALVRHQRFSADRGLTPAEYFDAYHRPLQQVWESAGPLVVTTGWDPLPRGSVGRLETPYSWRWDRTRALPDLPRPFGGVPSRGTPLAAVAQAVVGSRVVKVRVQSEGVTGGAEPLVQGSYYDADSNDWKYLMPLRGPFRGDGRFVWLLHAFQRFDRLVVVVRSDDAAVDGDAAVERVHAAAYDFELRAWSPWNGTPDLAAVARAVAELHEIDRFLFCRQPARMLQIVGDFNGTLYAVTHATPASGLGEVVVWFLNESPTGSYRPYWFRVVVPPQLETHSYSNPMVWPLLWFGGVAVVCWHRGELVWWFVRKSGVYHRGAFALTATAEQSPHNRYSLVYTQI